MTLDDFNKRKRKLPDTPGVYFFLGPRKEVLYVGKATSLRSRVRSYFSPDLVNARGPLLVQMLARARSIDFRETDTVLDALILEANLIRTHKPKYNTIEKDDKSFNYVVLTREDFPRLVVVRGKDLDQELPAETRLKTFGPFPHGLQLREALKLIRRIFPYRENCIPASEMVLLGKKPKPCFNRQIGLCPGVCAGDVTQEEYRKAVRHIVLLFEGKKKSLLKLLEREMKQAAREERFEEAAIRRRQLFALEHLQDVSLIKEEYRLPGGAYSFRIESYDIAHLGGSAQVGVMTVVEDGQTRPADYRKFRIRTVKGSNDPAALAEIIGRRLAHDEWRMPNLIVVDGGVAQMNAAQRTLDMYEVKIPIVGVVKDERHRPREIKGDRILVGEREKDILLANAEAHRSAIAYHRKKQRRNLLG